jgi:hypothetical protein
MLVVVDYKATTAAPTEPAGQQTFQDMLTQAVAAAVKGALEAVGKS